MSSSATMVICVIGCTLLLGAACTLASFLQFDRLLRIEYSRHKSDWERDGRPTGFFWTPPDAKTLSGSLVRSELVSSWTSSQPPWVGGDDQAAQAYARFRRFSKFASKATLVFIGVFALMWVGIIVLLSK